MFRTDSGLEQCQRIVESEDSKVRVESGRNRVRDGSGIMTVLEAKVSVESEEARARVTVELGEARVKVNLSESRVRRGQSPRHRSVLLRGQVRCGDLARLDQLTRAPNCLPLSSHLNRHLCSGGLAKATQIKPARPCVPTTIKYDVITPTGNLGFTADDWLTSPVSPSAILDFSRYGPRPPEPACSA
ncbi:hypothetical protein ElyMa_001043400 [Elysia marginata]|uniref:Uncharacterized protein n=1 Tax=Elysia marginata TaxID=1093978 RepID=A0AAV4HPD5_9GAST|nr:hypothetical protein ElyMa_001043400 [Elysia marginata]